MDGSRQRIEVSLNRGFADMWVTSSLGGTKPQRELLGTLCARSDDGHIQGRYEESHLDVTRASKASTRMLTLTAGRRPTSGAQAMTTTRLGSFIQQNIGAILCEWELFAKTKIPAAATMSGAELRGHAEEMLRQSPRISADHRPKRNATASRKAWPTQPTGTRRRHRHTAQFDTCPASI